MRCARSLPIDKRAQARRPIDKRAQARRPIDKRAQARKHASAQMHKNGAVPAQ